MLWPAASARIVRYWPRSRDLSVPQRLGLSKLAEEGKGRCDPLSQPGSSDLRGGGKDGEGEERLEEKQLTFEQCRGWGADPLCSQKSAYYF